MMPMKWYLLSDCSKFPRKGGWGRDTDRWSFRCPPYTRSPPATDTRGRSYTPDTYAGYCTAYPSDQHTQRDCGSTRGAGETTEKQAWNKNSNINHTQKTACSNVHQRKQPPHDRSGQVSIKDCTSLKNLGRLAVQMSNLREFHVYIIFVYRILTFNFKRSSPYLYVS